MGQGALGGFSRLTREGPTSGEPDDETLLSRFPLIEHGTAGASDSLLLADVIGRGL